MASPYQQQVRLRKLLYIALILGLFTVSLIWRYTAMAGLGKELAIRERGEVELIGSVVRLGLTGSRGLATCILWSTAIDKQKKNQWNELEVLVRSLTKLQPHFITPWLFQSWNLAYNVSVESDRVRDKYFYVSRGIELLAEGERQNRNQPDLRWSIGFYGQHKVGLSDETNYMRSLLQLSMIPPNERDPARFWSRSDNGPAEFNWLEFEKFCREHPQLVRRLREGIIRDTAQQKRQQFSCEKAEDVVQFLEDNYNLPGHYQFQPLPLGVPAQDRVWNASHREKLLDADTRFPVLPPARSESVMFDKSALTQQSAVNDSTDIYTVAHAWFSYSQEALPLPDKLPGSSLPITKPAEQRRPKNITTLIFRNYPAQACRYMAERLQQEGWFLDEGWDCSEWFQDARVPSLASKEIRVGGGNEIDREGTKWSLEAWKRAFRAWESHGNENHLLFDTEADEQNMRQLAERFGKKYQLGGNGMPPELREEELTEEERKEYWAARYIFEYNFYRQVSNFPHHYNRYLVEKELEAVTCRRSFYQAAQAEMSGSPRAALDIYRTPIETSAWKGKKLSPLDAWRDLVLLRNKPYRRDNYNQEQTAEIQLRYLRLQNRFDGRTLKENITKAAVVLPLVPKMTPDEFRMPILPGPFDVVDDEGQPLIERRSLELVMDRMNLSPKKAAPPPPSPPPSEK